jgi:hypothetical protein
MRTTQKVMSISVLLIMTWPLLSFGGTVNLPTTGQTTCYDSAGNVIDCADTGQDGDIQAGVTWPVPRFEDNGDGTIIDHLTGLIWLKNANRFGPRTWADALNDCNTLAADGVTLTDGSIAGDWRLPNVVELESLVNAQAASPGSWLNTQGFTSVQSSYYWSASTYASTTSYGYAWIVDMYYGLVYHYNKSYYYPQVWPVRGGQNGPAQTWRTGQTTSYATGDDGDLQRGVAWPSPRFTDNVDGTVTDNLTGLIWLKNANRFGPRTWADALNDCNTLAADGVTLNDDSVGGDWRLPNRKELFSLIDYSRYNPALPQGHPFVNVQSYLYRSASTYANGTRNAWDVYMYNGLVDYDAKSDTLYVWPVRDGQDGSAIEVTNLAPSAGGYGTKIKVNGSGFGASRSGMFDSTQGYYSFVTVSNQSMTMVATKYPVCERLWTDTQIVVSFKNLFIDQDSDYLQDAGEEFVAWDSMAPGQYAVGLKTIWFTDSNGNDVYDEGDTIDGTFPSGTVIFNLTTDPVIAGILPAEGQEPGKVIVIKGYNFGDGSASPSIVHINNLTYQYPTNTRIKLWSPTKIKIRIPFEQKGDAWFTEGEGTYRSRKAWVTVGTVDSNSKRFRVLNPDTTPSPSPGCWSCHDPLP